MLGQASSVWIDVGTSGVLLHVGTSKRCMNRCWDKRCTDRYWDKWCMDRCRNKRRKYGCTDEWCAWTNGYKANSNAGTATTNKEKRRRKKEKKKTRSNDNLESTTKETPITLAEISNGLCHTQFLTSLSSNSRRQFIAKTTSTRTRNTSSKSVLFRSLRLKQAN